MYLAIITLPLLGSIVSGFFGRKVGVSGAQLITCTCVIITTLLAIVVFIEVGLNNIPVSINLFRWIDSESLNVLWGFHFDSLTVAMLIPVLIVSSLVHIYSIGYMNSDPQTTKVSLRGSSLISLHKRKQVRSSKPFVIKRCYSNQSPLALEGLSGSKGGRPL